MKEIHAYCSNCSKSSCIDDVKDVNGLRDCVACLRLTLVYGKEIPEGFKVMA